MRVLMVSDVYFPRVNGVSTSIETFRRGLAAAGVEVIVVAPRYAVEVNENEVNENAPYALSVESETSVGRSDFPLCKRGMEGDLTPAAEATVVEIPPAPLFQRGGLPNHRPASPSTTNAYSANVNEVDANEVDVNDVVRVRSRPVPRDPEDRLMAWREARRVVLREAADCDLIHIQTPFVAHYAGLHAARRLGKPVLATYHTFFEEYLHHYAPFVPAAWMKALARRFARAQCNALDALVVPSTAMCDRLLDYGVTRPMHVLPTGIPLDRFVPGEGTQGRVAFRAAHGIAPDRPVVLFVGRVAHEKNIAYLLEAVAKARRIIPDLLFLVTGEGPAEPALKAKARALGLEDAVRFLGYLDRRRALPDAYAAADAFVFASRTETQGLVLLEAMAMGLPVVALAAMGTRDILEARRGCLVPEDEVTDFAAAITRLLKDADLRRQLAAEAREHAMEWADDRMAGRLADLYHSLVRGSAGQAVSHNPIGMRLQQP